MSTVSIIIPSYNSAAYIAETIQSCLDQTYKDIEVIVVDDGSTDNTRSIVERYPVQYIYQANAGPAAARNNGWRASQSEYLQFLDADDILLPTKIERCLQAFTSDIDVVYTDFEHRTADLKGSLPTPRTITPEGDILNLLLNSTRALFPIHAPLIRRSTAERTRKFNEKIKITEDWYFWVELAALGAQFRYLDEILVWYRIISTSLSRNQVTMAQARLNAAQALIQLPLPETFDVHPLISERHHVLAVRQWEAGNRSAAREQFRQAIQANRHQSRRNMLRYCLILMTYVFHFSTVESILNRVLKLRHFGDS